MVPPSREPGSDARLDGVRLFSLRHDRLLPGDVVLMRNRFARSAKGSKRSGAIALLTRGRFSHAAICTILPTAIEATPDGVANFTLASTYFHDVRNVRVLRYPDRRVAARAAEKASGFLGMGYSVPLAIRSVLPGLAAPAVPHPATFCSALVAAAFVASGAPEFARRNPYRIHPAALERMTFFDDVTAGATREFLVHENIEDMNALDGDRRRSFLAAHTPAYGRIHDAVADDLRRLIDVHRLKTTPPNSFFESFLLIIGNINYCLGRPEIEIDPFRSDVLAIDAKFHRMMVEGGLERSLDVAVDADADRMRGLSFRAQLAEPGVDLDDLEALLLNSYVQCEARLEAIDPPRCPAGASASWDLWESMGRRSVEAIEERCAIIEAALNRMAPERLAMVRARRAEGDAGGRD